MTDPAFRTMKVFDCHKMPDDIRKKYFGLFDHLGNESFIECMPGEWLDDGGDSKLVGEWLIANGAGEEEEVFVKYNW